MEKSAVDVSLPIIDVRLEKGVLVGCTGVSELETVSELGPLFERVSVSDALDTVIVFPSVVLDRSLVSDTPEPVLVTKDDDVEIVAVCCDEVLESIPSDDSSVLEVTVTEPVL